MRRINSFFATVIITLFGGVILTSCGGADPKETAEEAVNAELARDYEKLYSLLSTSDKDAASLENFTRFYAMPTELADAMEVMPEVKDAIKAEKFESQINGETAVVTYFITLPDFNNIGNLSLADAQQLLSVKGKSIKDLPDELKQKIIDSVKKDGVPTISHAKQMQLKREGDEWKVDMRLAEQIKSSKIRTVYDVNSIAE